MNPLHERIRRLPAGIESLAVGFLPSPSVDIRGLTIAQPPLVAGDVMVAVITPRLSGGGAIGAPAGWTRVRRDSNIGGASLSQALYVKVATMFEPPSYRWTFSSPVDSTGGVTAFLGVDTLAPVQTHGGLYSANTRLIAAPSLTTSVDGALVVGWFGNSARNTIA